jgi:hypothetical protein
MRTSRVWSGLRPSWRIVEVVVVELVVGVVSVTRQG